MFGSFDPSNEATAFIWTSYALLIVFSPLVYYCGKNIFSRIHFRKSLGFFVLGSLPWLVSILFLRLAITNHLGILHLIYVPGYYIVLAGTYLIAISYGVQKSRIQWSKKRQWSISVLSAVLLCVITFIGTEKPHRRFIYTFKQKSFRKDSQKELTDLGYAEPLVTDYDKYLGINTEKREDGLLYEIGIKEPYTGTVLEFYKQDRTKSVHKVHTYTSYYKGKRHGDAWEWLRDGAKHKLAQYNEGVLEGQYFEWIGGGLKREAGSYMNGKKNGLWKSWYLNGQLNTETEYAEGVMHGVNAHYGFDGKMRSLSHHNAGELHGDYKMWDHKGELNSHSTYTDGKQTYSWRRKKSK
jgi:antitoxin component YwqK of YwqJK toxin-antitoxin module